MHKGKKVCEPHENVFIIISSVVINNNKKKHAWGKTLFSASKIFFGIVHPIAHLAHMDMDEGGDVFQRRFAGQDTFPVSFLLSLFLLSHLPPL